MPLPMPERRASEPASTPAELNHDEHALDATLWALALVLAILLVSAIVLKVVLL